MVISLERNVECDILFQASGAVLAQKMVSLVYCRPLPAKRQGGIAKDLTLRHEALKVPICLQIKAANRPWPAITPRKVCRTKRYKLQAEVVRATQGPAVLTCTLLVSEFSFFFADCRLMCTLLPQQATCS